jgi:PAS domain S-box-containing protein
MTTQRGPVDGGWTGFQRTNGDDAAANVAPSDLINILDAVEVPLIVLRRDSTISYFNKAAADVLGLSPTDSGRTSGDIPVLASMPHLEKHCGDVIAGGAESRVNLRHGDKWFVVRISPHASVDRQVAGTVLTFTDVTAFRASIDQAIYEREFTKAILNTVADPLIVLSADQRIQTGNHAFYTMFGISRDETQGLPIHELGSGVSELAPFRKQLKEMFAVRPAFQPIEVNNVLTVNGLRTLLLDAHPLSFPGHSERKILMTFRDITERKQAEAGLRELNDRLEKQVRVRTKELSLIIETIPGLVWCTGPDGEFNYLNRRILDYTGTSSDAWAHLGWTNFLHPDDVDPTLRAWSRSIATGQPYDHQCRLRRSDGIYRWFSAHGQAAWDGDGRVTRWYGLITDIEDRKRAEEALKSSEERHRVIVEAANDAVISMDENGYILLANPSTMRMFGYELAEILGRPLTILMPESMRKLHENGYKRYLATGERHLNWHGVEVTAQRKNGQEFPVEVSFGEMTSEGRQIFTGFIRDISEKKKAEETLRASEQSLRLIVDSIPGMVFNMTSQGEFDLANRQFLEYTGKTLQEMKNWQTIVHPDDLPIVRSRLSVSLETGSPFDTEVRLRRADSEYRWFHCCGLPLRDENGQIIRWYKLLTDIEDRKHAEEALRNSQTQLSRATRTATVGEFAAAIAHEINQPLAAVVANGHACLRWLSTQPPGLAKAQQAAERIVRDGTEAGEVVRRIRALFKQAPLEKLDLDLNEIIGEVLGLLGGETSRRRVIVDMDLEKNLGPVAGDRIQLQQLLFNLLLNGIEAMDSVLDRPKKLFISSRQHDLDSVLVEIRDCGTGLKDSEKVFDAFFTTKENGMGMGLAICRSIIDAHHGRLWAVSAEKSGTTFSFTLPVGAKGHHES